MVAAANVGIVVRIVSYIIHNYVHTQTQGIHNVLGVINEVHMLFVCSNAIAVTFRFYTYCT